MKADKYSDGNLEGKFSERYFQASFDNPPFFPKDLDELAQDASYSIKIGLVSNINRMRIDLRSRLIVKDRFAIKWLLLLVQRMIDDDINKIHILIDAKYDLDYSRSLLSEMKFQDHQITISRIVDDFLCPDDKMLVIFNPNNVMETVVSDRSLLEDVQAICFHSSLRNIPVVIINPVMIATAWNNFGARPPL